MGIAILSFIRKLFGRGMPAGQCQAAPAIVTPLPAARTVRVVHKGPGRIVISGRLADVCAELDRLAALESAQALAPAR